MPPQETVAACRLLLDNISAGGQPAEVAHQQLGDIMGYAGQVRSPAYDACAYVAGSMRVCAHVRRC